MSGEWSRERPADAYGSLSAEMLIAALFLTRLPGDALAIFLAQKRYGKLDSSTGIRIFQAETIIKYSSFPQRFI